ncbi:MAG: glycoside-pentoside-hexuronide (GPH):cation symporter [Eubacteriales bacterium]|nr:glycoside-pentoside-hexuronide (GPH):cation symporter [Eubacteriales bacterium]
MAASKSPMFTGDKEFEKIHLKEKVSYGLGDVACNVVFALTTSLLIYFYTNVVEMDVGMIGTIMLISRVFDGISDVLIGHLVDRTHSKLGKSRAWILWMMIPYGISAVLLFTVPPASTIVKAVYVFITYNFCTTVVYTALNLPYATLATLMTRDTDQRAVINLFRTGMSALGNMVITTITFPLVTWLGDTQQAWIKVSIAYAIISIILLLVCFCNCHERVTEQTKTKDGKNVPLGMGIRLCLTNQYFVLFFLLAIFLSFYEAVTGTCNAYYAQYILGNRDLTGALASFESIPQIVTVLLLAPFIAKFGKRNVALIGASVAVLGMIPLLFHPSARNLALLACVMRGIGKGCFRGVKYSMLADVIEYGAWKSGVRVQGLMISATTAGQKFGSGITTAAFGALMSLVGFAGTATINATQSSMLIHIYIIGNIIAWGGIAILLTFYKLDQLYPQIITEMKARESIARTKQS